MTEVANSSASDDFIKGDTCSYIITGPSRGNSGDYLKFKLWEMDNGSAYIHYGTSYSNAPDSRTKMSRGKTYTVEMPNTVYISVFATKVFFAKFYVEAWYEEAPEPEPEPEDPVVPDD